MASLKARNGKWYAQFYDSALKQCRVSTGLDVSPAPGKGTAAGNRKAAQKIADTLEAKAKGLIPGEVAKAYLRAASMVDDSAALSVGDYLRSYRPSGKEQSQSNARRAIALFLDYLAAHNLDTTPLDKVKAGICADFLGSMLQEVATGTVRNHKHQLSAAFNRAVADELIQSNPFSLLRMDSIVNQYAPELKGTDKTQRKPFTADEMRRLLFEFPQPWRDVVAVSFYTGGQRIGDCIKLTWQQVDFERGLIHFVTQKTGKAITHPLREELRRRLEARRAASTDATQEHVFPLLASRHAKAPSQLSTEFTALLAAHGILDEAAPAEMAGKRKRLSAKSFHSIRHTVVSMLRGSNEVSADVCRAVVGHDSEEIERAYFSAPAAAVSKAFDVLESHITPTDSPEH